MPKGCAAPTLLSLCLLADARHPALGIKQFLRPLQVTRRLLPKVAMRELRVASDAEACTEAALSRRALDSAVRQRIRILPAGIRKAYATALYKEIRRSPGKAHLAADKLAHQVALAQAPPALENLLHEPKLRNAILALPAVDREQLTAEARILWRLVGLLLACLLVARKPGALAMPLPEALGLTRQLQKRGEPGGMPKAAAAAREELLTVGISPGKSTSYVLSFAASVLAAKMPALNTESPMGPAYLYIAAELHAQLPRFCGDLIAATRKSTRAR